MRIWIIRACKSTGSANVELRFGVDGSVETCRLSFTACRTGHRKHRLMLEKALTLLNSLEKVDSCIRPDA